MVSFDLPRCELLFVRYQVSSIFHFRRCLASKSLAKSESRLNLCVRITMVLLQQSLESEGETEKKRETKNEMQNSKISSRD